MENGSPNGITKKSKSEPWVCEVACFEILKGFENTYFSMIFWVSKKFAKNLKCRTLWQTKLWAIFGRGRRERRGAGKEKEEGLLITIDCVFKS